MAKAKKAAKSDCEFKSAKDLGLEQKEWEALIQTLMLMEAGAIIHVDTRKNITRPPEGKFMFNMQDWREDFTGCGSVCCIGGSAEFFGKLPFNAMGGKAYTLQKNGDSNLAELFFPGEYTGFRGSWRKLTPQQAAKALRGYLTTGTTNWSQTTE